MPIRRLSLEEMDAAAELFRAAYDNAFPWLAGRHTAAEDKIYFRESVFAKGEVWGLMENDVLLGYIAFRLDWVDHLYVLPSAQGRGIGSALLTVAQAAFPRLYLWTFQRNLVAQNFYEARGFVAVRKTDGDNEEKEPDLLYRFGGASCGA